MKKLFFYLYTLCAVAALVLLVYQAAPVFPYINDPEIMVNALALVVFYYLAYSAARKNKNARKIPSAAKPV